MVPVALVMLSVFGFRDVQDWVTGLVLMATLVAMSFTGSNLGEAMRRQWLAAETSARRDASRAATAERVRISRDMHDTVAGDLAGSILLAQVLRDLLASENTSDQASATATQIVDLCTTAHVHTREAISALRKADAHPAAELGDLCVQWSARTAVACTLNVGPEVDGLDPQLFADLKAVLLELLENVRRHAGAFNVTIDLGVIGGEAVLVVSDDGRGLRKTDRKLLVDDGHFGLAGVDERVAGRGGSVRRAKAAGGGLLTEVRFPVVAREEITV